MSKIARMMQQATAGAGGAGLDVDNVFSTFLFTGAGSGTSTIANGIDLSGEGGLVWIKSRTGTSGEPHFLVDTERGGSSVLQSNSTAAANNFIGNPSFLSNGFSGTSNINDAQNYVSWTFRKAPKFFDIVTYTGTSSTQAISHNLGSVPGMIMIKCTSGTGNWRVYHRGINSSVGYSNPEEYVLILNGTNEAGDSSSYWNDTAPTSTHFTVAGDDDVNDFGDTFVAYLFAHNNNDGGFGPDADQDIIKCGSYNGNGSASGPSINLGFEPQFLMIKRASGANGWNVFDTMRGWTNNAGYVDNTIAWNTTDAEGTGFYWHNPTSTGFDIAASNDNVNANNHTYVYMAIRRGPLAVPDDATKVFNVNTYSNNSNSNIYNTGFDVDMSLSTNRDGNNNFIKARMTGTKYLQTNATAAEGATTTAKWFNSKSNSLDLATNWWGSNNAVSWAWRRAPSYFDVVCYTGNSTSNTEIKHNLGAVPEMVWTKRRSGTRNWVVYHTALGINNTMWLNEDSQADDESAGMHATPTATSLFLKGNNYTNLSGATHIAYLFATVAGVSKVGSYTGNGSSQNIDCGFSSGARFVLIKRTDVSEGWKVHDSVRGIVAGNDPFIELNNNNAENSSFDLLDPYSGGFAVNNFYGWNGSGGSYIFYAIA